MNINKGTGILNKSPCHAGLYCTHDFEHPKSSPRFLTDHHPTNIRYFINNGKDVIQLDLLL